MLLVGVLLLVAIFQTSDNLAHAYGLAVTGTMLVTTSLAYIVVRADVEVAAAGAPSLLIGPLVADRPDLPGRQRAEDALRRLGAGADRRARCSSVMATWVRGIAAADRQDPARQRAAGGPAADILRAAPRTGCAGTAIFLTSDPDVAPRAR